MIRAPTGRSPLGGNSFTMDLSLSFGFGFVQENKVLIRQAFRPVACEILTDELQILVPRLFVPLNLRVTLATLYQGSPTPGDSIPAVYPRCPRGVPAVSLRRNVVWCDPLCATCCLIWAHVVTMGPDLGRLWIPLVSTWARFVHH